MTTDETEDSVVTCPRCDAEWPAEDGDVVDVMCPTCRAGADDGGTITYAQARRDHEYLWGIGPAADCDSGGYDDGRDMAALLRSPTQETARACYHRQVRHWCAAGPEPGCHTGWLDDARVAEIARRHGCAEALDAQRARFRRLMPIADGIVRRLTRGDGPEAMTWREIRDLVDSETGGSLGPSEGDRVADLVRDRHQAADHNMLIQGDFDAGEKPISR